MCVDYSSAFWHVLNSSLSLYCTVFYVSNSSKNVGLKWIACNSNRNISTTLHHCSRVTDLVLSYSSSRSLCSKALRSPASKPLSVDKFSAFADGICFIRWLWSRSLFLEPRSSISRSALLHTWQQQYNHQHQLPWPLQRHHHYQATLYSVVI